MKSSPKKLSRIEKAARKLVFSFIERALSVPDSVSEIAAFTQRERARAFKEAATKTSCPHGHPVFDACNFRLHQDLLALGRSKGKGS